ncbi:MAG: CBS domain-containing protein [Deltaproteobacteria bacterium]|nr:CBS domain-containing protein [Deltaproteobacteria bacterium]
MKKNDPVRSIMTDQLVTAKLTDSFSGLKQKMEENKIHHIPVVEGQTLVGMISRLDILKFSHSREYINDGTIDGDLDKFVTVEKLMTKNPVSIKVTDTVRHAVEILTQNSFNSLPVVEGESGHLAGIITTKDIMAYLVNQY